MTAAIDYAARTVKIYRGSYDAAARAAIVEHAADLMNPHATTKLQVGLGNAENTSDLGKPVSTATAAALALKAPLASPPLTGTPTAPTAPLGTGTTQIASTAFVQGAVNAAGVPAVAANLAAHVAHTNNPHGVDKTDVGLGNVANLAPADLPVSNATQTALTAVDAAADATAADLTAHKANVANPHATTKAQIGLPLADNTSDLAKPVSSATQTALNLKAPFASPALTGTPTAPTAAPGASTTQLATTAFVTAADAVIAGGAAAAQADADQALAAAADAQEDADQAIIDAAAAQGAAAAAQVDADAAQAAADAAQADATQALADAAAAQAAADAAQASADEALAQIGHAAAVYGTSKTGAADDAELIDPTWIVTSAAGQVVRVDAAVAADPQTVALVPAVLLEPGHTYTVRWRVQRQADPVDPINDSVTLGVQWLDSAYAATGSVTVEDIALVVVDGVEERSARLALAPAVADAEVDHEAPPGTLYFRPYVDCYGDSHVTDIVLIDGGGGACCSSPAIAGMFKTGGNATEMAIEALIAAGTTRPAHGNLLKVQAAGTLISRTLETIAGDRTNIRAYAPGDDTVQTAGIQAWIDALLAQHDPLDPGNPNMTTRTRLGYLPGGKYRAHADNIIFNLPGYSTTIKGDGPISQLYNATLQLDANDNHVESLRIRGSGAGVGHGVGVDIRAGAAKLLNVEVWNKDIGIQNVFATFAGGLASNHTAIGGWIRDCNTGILVGNRDYRGLLQRVNGFNVGLDIFDEGGTEMLGSNITGNNGPGLLVRGNLVRFTGNIAAGSPVISNIVVTGGDYDTIKIGDVISGAVFVEEDDYVNTSALAPRSRVTAITPTTITLDGNAIQTLTNTLMIVTETPIEFFMVANTFGAGAGNKFQYNITSIESVAARTFAADTHSNTTLDNITPSLLLNVNLFVGQLLTGAGFQANTRVASIINATTITLTLPTSSTLTQTTVTTHNINVSFATETLLTKHMGGVRLVDTGVPFYDDENNATYIVAVAADTKTVTLSFPYVGPLVNNSGTALLTTAGDAAQYLATGPSNAQIRSVFTVAGNQNGSRFKGGVNYSFIGTRLKARSYMHGFRPFFGNCSTGSLVISAIDIPVTEIRVGTHITLGSVLQTSTHVVSVDPVANSITIDKFPIQDRTQGRFSTPEQPNNIFHVMMPDDQQAGGSTVNPASATIRNSDQPFVGTGSLLGWSQVGMFRNGVTSAAAAEGSFAVGMRCAYTMGGLLDNQPRHLNYMGVMNRGLRWESNTVQYDIQGTSFRVETGTLTFEENGTTLAGTGYFAQGVPVTITAQARRSHNGDLYPNAIHRWASPKKDTAEDATELAAYAVAPGEADVLTRSFFLGCCTGDPVLTGDTTALRLLPSSIELRSAGQVSLWKSGFEYGRFSSAIASDSFLWVDGDGPARLAVLNTNTTGTNAIASLAVRNQATPEAGLRLVASGAAFTNGGTPLPYLPADAGALVSGSLLSGGFSIAAGAGDMKFWIGPTPTLAMTIAAAGNIAFAVPIVQKPAASAIPANNGELTMSAASNTSVVIRLKGTDGVVRSGNLALA